ncbi:hypothetical protein [Psychrobacter immobilis]|nr:hypothetical protein [Psychrobacter immobilis]
MSAASYTFSTQAIHITRLFCYQLHRMRNHTLNNAVAMTIK